MPRCGSGEAKPLWRFDGSQCGLMWGLGRRTRVCHRADVGWRQCESGFWDDAAGEKRRFGSETQSRPLSVIADEERTYGGRNRCRCSCRNSQRGRCANGLPADEGLDDRHRGTTVRADEGGRDVGGGDLRRLRFGRGGDDVQ